MRLASALELEICLDSGRWTLYVCMNLNWNSFPIVLCVACGGGSVIMRIGATQTLKGPPVIFCSCGIGGCWRRSKSI